MDITEGWDQESTETGGGLAEPGALKNKFNQGLGNRLLLYSPISPLKCEMWLLLNGLQLRTSGQEPIRVRYRDI